MIRPPEKLKPLSAQLAQQLSAQESVQALQDFLQQQLTMLESIGQVGPAPNPGDGESTPSVKEEENARPELPARRGRAGIWEPIEEHGRLAFVRPENGDPWGLWANVERIDPKDGRARVVLLGESVARGFLLDPQFNCALALQTLLQADAGAQEVEVKDLARCGFSFSQLEEVLAGSLALEPDALIIFAGNNWHIPVPESLDFRQLAALLRQAGRWAAISAQVEEVVRAQVRLLVQALGSFSAQIKIPILFIIPEFNLLDWKCEHEFLNPLLTGEQVLRRFRIQSEAEESLAVGEVELAMALAEELIELDERTHPAGFEILAKCKLTNGELADARRLLEKARDSTLSLPVKRIPKCYRVIQDVLRHEGPSHGLHIVDLPQRFSEYAPDQLPDRRFFLDYCHMTVEGVQLAMASAAEVLLPLLGRPARSWRELNGVDLKVDQATVAKSYFRAAVINAFAGQSSAVVRSKCEEAIRLAPEMSESIKLFVDLHVRCAPNMMCKELEGLQARDEISSIIKYLTHLNVYANINEKDLYLPLIRAFTDVLSRDSHGDADVRRAARDLLLQEHGADGSEVNLLHQACLAINFASPASDWQGKYGYFKSYRPTLSVRLVCKRACSLRLVLTCRVVCAESVNKPVSLFVNGLQAHGFLATMQWQTLQTEIPAHLLHEGVNILIIRWPELDQSRDERISQVAREFELVGARRDFPEIFAVYGEVHEFRARMQETALAAAAKSA
jgi:hypothetical protein